MASEQNFCFLFRPSRFSTDTNVQPSYHSLSLRLTAEIGDGARYFDLFHLLIKTGRRPLFRSSPIYSDHLYSFLALNHTRVAGASFWFRHAGGEHKGNSRVATEKTRRIAHLLAD